MGRTTTICPCRGCKDRVAATKENPYSCHMSCEKYAEWREQFTAYKFDAAADMHFDAVEKLKRMQHLKRRK